MSGVVLDASLSAKAISVDLLTHMVKSNNCGAVVTFSGEVRNLDKGKTVERLKYEIHPTTEKVLQEIVHEIAAKYDVLRCAVIHRHGEIPIGESALAIAVATPHRGEAFRACSELVDEIKSRVPIWKHQVFSDGTDEWVNCA
ncbi:MAG: molybdenum cofactor biosynthesis protein MoaE [Actinobacteria bacterium]|nr:molybdenum cofactor biosynthesis protein MoaE [Actinomycetota bacterium]